MIIFATTMLGPRLLAIRAGCRWVPVVALGRSGRTACIAFIVTWWPRRTPTIRLRRRVPITGTQARPKRRMIDPSSLVVIPRLPTIIIAPISIHGERDDRQADGRAISQDGRIGALIRIAECGSVNPATQPYTVT